MNSSDRILRGLVAGSQARFVAVVATRLVSEAAQRHAATGNAAIAMGRAGAAGLLLATLAKGDERVTLQILGGGPFGAVTVDASSAGNARVFLRHPSAAAIVTDLTGRPRVGAWIGRAGIVSVVRDLGMREHFGGQTAMVDGEIDTDVEKYLSDSEQIDSALACETLIDRTGKIACAVGVLVQALPGGEGTVLLDEARQRLRGGALTSALLPIVKDATSGNLVDAMASAALGEHADMLDILDVRSVAFHCPCTRARARATLVLLGEEDLYAMIREEGDAEVICDFCRASYRFSDSELEELRRGLRGNAEPFS
jgi:molecular chaperone Hsp33